MPTYLGADTETHRIGKGQVIPPMVCAQFAVYEEGSPFPWIIERARPDYREEILTLLKDDSIHWVFHNAAYDLSVLSQEIPGAMELIWKAFDEHRIHDTMIREMLYNLTATGDIDNIEVNDVVQRAEYSLAALVKKYTGIDRSEAKDGEDSTRLNYEMVEDMLLKDWPAEFVEYAENDPSDTLVVFFEQEMARERLKERIGYDPFVTESFRVCVHFALQLMTNVGNVTDKEAILNVTKEFDTLYNDPELVKPLVLSHFIEETAKANNRKITKGFIKECVDAFDGMPQKEQDKWIGTGIVIPAIPPKPYANGALEHREDCVYNKNGPKFCGKALKDCGCPPKMTAAQNECGSDKALHSYIWNAAKDNECMEVWASDSLKKKLKEEGVFDDYISFGKTIDQKAVGSEDIPKGWLLSVDQEWLASFAVVDPLLEIYHTRKEYQKIVTSYLPGLYWNNDYLNCPDIIEGETSRLGKKEPTDIVHSCFRPLKRTGRTSSYANTHGKGRNKVYMYPSMNGQQVDPRIRPCIVPREGYKLFSIDYSAMELGTAAQTCINLFGFSVLGDIINAGGDSHAYLGTSIARELDDWFAGCTKGMDQMEAYQFFSTLAKAESPCPSRHFLETWKSLGKEGEPKVSDYYKHYRTFAKPTGLGYPGGLGPKTFVAYAKATYGITVDLSLAENLREIWKNTFPEMRKYLDYVSKQCYDRNHMPEILEDEEGKQYRKVYYSYDTPMGMHRAKTDFCACANGQALQSISAEGALLGLCEIQREIHSGCGSILSEGVRPTIFIHDEIFGEIKDDELLTPRIQRMQQIMKECMEIVTPDVKAGTEACIMNRWSKKAFPYYVDGKLRPYEEKLEKDKEKEKTCSTEKTQ